MSIIKLSSGFNLIPEGTYVFHIDEVTYDENFGKLDIKLSTESGLVHHEKYGLLKATGEPNEGALTSFSFMAKAALDDPDLAEIDPTALVGHFIQATVEHYPYEGKNGKMYTGARLNDKEAANGWYTPAPTQAPASAYTSPASAGFDLNAFLNS